MQLSNGCACCSVKNDFVKALESLMSKEGVYDYILIETTGASSASKRCMAFNHSISEITQLNLIPQGMIILPIKTLGTPRYDYDKHCMPYYQ